MSDGERKVLEAAGDYRYAVRDGEPVPDAPWQSARIVLTSERLALATDSDERSIPVGRLEVPAELPAGVSADGATPVRIGDAVLLIDAGTAGDLESAYCRAILHDAVVLVDHPGDAPQDATGGDGWSKAKVRIDDERLVLRYPDGGAVRVDFGDVEEVDASAADVRGDERPTLAVGYADEGGQLAETRVAGMEGHVGALERLLRGVAESDSAAVDLDETDREVLVALYSGVSPFDVPAFVGLDVGEVEAAYERLREAGAVEAVRERTEVALTEEGRNLASAAMGEE